MDTETVVTTPGSASETAGLPDAASWMPDPDEVPDAPDLSMWVPAGSEPELDVEPPREGIGALVAGAGLLTALIAGLGVFNVWGGVGLAIAGSTAGASAVLGPVAIADYKRRLKNGPRRGQNRNGWSLRRPTAGRSNGSTRSSGRGGRLLPHSRSRGAAAARRTVGAAGAGKSLRGRLASALPKSGRSASVGRKSTRAARSVGAVGRSTRSGAGRSSVGRSSSGARSLPIVGGLRERLRRRREPMRAAREQHRVGQLRKRLKERAARVDARRQRRRSRWSRAGRGLGRGLVAVSVRPARWIGRQARRPFVAAWRRTHSSRLARILRVVGVGTLLSMALSSLARSIGDVLRNIPAWMWAPETEEEKAAKAAVRAAQQKKAATPPAPVQPPPLVKKPDHVLPTWGPNGAAPAVQRPGRPTRSSAAPTFLPPGPRFDAPAVPTPRPVKGPAMAHGAALHPVWDAIVDTFRDQLGSWEMPGPGEGVPDTDHLLSSMGDAFRQIGEIVTAFGQKLDGDTFVEAEVCDYVGDVATSLTAMGEEADDVYATWREVQDADIQRHENPRPAEESANV